MKLTGATVLEGVIDALRDQVAPQLNDAFAADAARMAQSLIAIVGRAGDDAVAIRVAENAHIRELLGQGGLAAAAASKDPGLRISELDAENSRLRTLLVELHARVELEDDIEARELDQAIWRALRDFEMARAPRG
ncbi:hypothetical protein [Novosphingobium sp. JCM 18896]|uniref:hypothetical protein n=1 Tax=Novosphingobium sp. JCM 18896 TaxID=2989731 RepID=UPI0022222F2C|nr:hypothetical protein [Novosphingobium sp. JCM 18896]MCW1428352.1 hypothetical protein [Novosphingobium sp. JCM 18896]